MNGDEQQLTKRERRELRKQERVGQASSVRTKRTVRRLGIWGGVLLGVGLLIYGLAQLGSGLPTPAEGELAMAVSESDWIKGNPNSTITLIEYADFQCPACAAYYPLIEQLIRDNSDEFRFVYRHFPLKSIHPNAEAASRASEAAGLQGKFWEMYGLLYSNQSSWSNLVRSAADDRFVEYAKQIGLDETKFKEDFDSGAVKDKVDQQIEGGTASNVSSTPSFFLNGKKITNPQSYDQFVQVISGSTTQTTEPTTEPSGPTPTP